MSLDCVGLVNEKVRARVVLSGYTVETPYVKSSSIERARGRLAATFSVSVEIPVSATFVAGADIEIWTSVNNNWKRKFVGTIKSVTSQPHFNKAGYFIMNMNGVDRLGELEGKTFSRRLRSDGFSLFVSIDGGPSNRPTRGVSVDKRIRGGKHQTTASSPKPTSTEHSQVTKMPKRGANKHGPYARAESLGAGEKDGSSGFKIHDHTTMEKGGPSFGTYSAD